MNGPIIEDAMRWQKLEEFAARVKAVKIICSDGAAEIGWRIGGNIGAAREKTLGDAVDMLPEGTPPVRSPERPAHYDRTDLWSVFHYLWGQSKTGEYDKDAWTDLQALMPQKKLAATPTAYPEHEKLAAVQEQSQAVGGFLEWLEPATGIQLAQPHRHCTECYTFGLLPEAFRAKYGPEGETILNPDEMSNGRFNTAQCGAYHGQLHRATFTVENLLAGFFEIDTAAIEAEKRAMLAACKQASTASKDPA